MIYNKSIFGLHPQFLTHSSQNLWNFLSVESKAAFCHVNDVTFRKYLEMVATEPICE